MTSPRSDLPPPGVAERVHRYFASFLSPPAADEAMAELEAVTRGLQTPLSDVLRAAHQQLAARVDVPLDIELPVLLEDLGVPPQLAAHAVGAPVETVERLAAEQDLSARVDPLWTPGPMGGTEDPSSVPVAEVGPEPPQPPAAGQADQDDHATDTTPWDPAPAVGDDLERPRAPRPVRATRRAVVAGVFLAVVLLVAAALWARAPDASGCEPTVERPVCVVESRLTHVIDTSGAPGASRSSFEADETVRLWFRYETLDPGQTYTVNYAWFHEGEVLYATAFPLPRLGRVNLTLARAAVEQPGDYRVEVRLDDHLLVDERFQVAG